MLLGGGDGDIEEWDDVDEPYKMHLLKALTMALYAGAKKKRTHFSFGPTTNSIQMARLLSVRLRKDKIEITCVGENDLVHAEAA